MRATEKVTFFADVWEIISALAFYGHPHSSLLFNIPGGERAEGADEVFWCEMFPFDINIHDLRGEKNRLRTPGDDLF